MSGVSTFEPGSDEATEAKVAEPLADPAAQASPGGAGALAATGLLALAACGGPAGSPGGGAPVPAPTPVPTVTPITSKQASRFLSQAAIGYSRADITVVTNCTCHLVRP